jgi:hypothetical protein
MQEAVENVIIDKKKEEKNTTAYLLINANSMSPLSVNYNFIRKSSLKKLF